MNVQSKAMEIISDKKKGIFESMLGLIKDHGFHGAPMSLVAKNAGVAAGTIYHYFESKDELIRALHDYNRTRIIEIIEAAIAQEKSYKERFFEIWHRLYEFYIANPNVLIFFEQYINSPYKQDRCPNYLHGQLYTFFEEGIATGIFKAAKPELLIVLIMGNVSSVAKMSVFGNILFEARDLKQITEILWEGISIRK